MWTKDERNFLKKLNTPYKIQQHLDDLIYNPVDDALSPRWVMLTGDGHCLEGGLLAAAALEYHGHLPLMVNLQAEDDDHHAFTVYKVKTGWGSLSKSNTNLLRGRDPVFKNVRELVMSYFDFYFNLQGSKSLYSYSNPINLNRYNHLNWRTTDENLKNIGISFNDLKHHELVDHKFLKRLPKVSKRIMDACFLGADPEGLFRVDLTSSDEYLSVSDDSQIS
jgi:hypothetical protein